MKTGMPTYRLSRCGLSKEMVLYTEVYVLTIFGTSLLCGLCTEVVFVHG